MKAYLCPRLPLPWLTTATSRLCLPNLSSDFHLTRRFGDVAVALHRFDKRCCRTNRKAGYDYAVMQNNKRRGDVYNRGRYVFVHVQAADTLPERESTDRNHEIELKNKYHHLNIKTRSWRLRLANSSGIEQSKRLSFNRSTYACGKKGVVE